MQRGSKISAISAGQEAGFTMIELFVVITAVTILVFTPQLIASFSGTPVAITDFSIPNDPVQRIATIVNYGSTRALEIRNPAAGPTQISQSIPLPSDAINVVSGHFFGATADFQLIVIRSGNPERSAVPDTGRALVFNRNGAGQFELMITGNIDLGIINAGPAAVGDFNNDGRQDLAVGSTLSAVNGYQIAALYNTGSSFTSSITYTQQIGGSESVVSPGSGGDLDGSVVGSAPTSTVDGGTGIKSVAAYSQSTASKKRPTLPIGESVAPASGGIPSLAVGDLNGDNIADIAALATNLGHTSIITYLGGASLTASTQVSLAPSDMPVKIIAAKIFGSPRADLATANFDDNGTNGTVTVLRNMGSMQFATPQRFNVGSNPIDIVAADLDGDNKVELITANQYGYGGIQATYSTISVLAGFQSSGSIQLSNVVVGGPFDGPTRVLAGKYSAAATRKELIVMKQFSQEAIRLYSAIL